MRLTPDQQEKLRRARESAGLTQIDLAVAIGYKTNRVVSQAERGGYVSEDMLSAICSVLGLTFTPSRPAEIGEVKK